jgi:hypothetical protein
MFLFVGVYLSFVLGIVEANIFHIHTSETWDKTHEKGTTYKG